MNTEACTFQFSTSVGDSTLVLNGRPKAINLGAHSTSTQRAAAYPQSACCLPYRGAPRPITYLLIVPIAGVEFRLAGTNPVVGVAQAPPGTIYRLLSSRHGLLNLIGYVPRYASFYIGLNDKLPKTWRSNLNFFFPGRAGTDMGKHEKKNIFPACQT